MDPTLYHWMGCTQLGDKHESGGRTRKQMKRRGLQEIEFVVYEDNEKNNNERYRRISPWGSVWGGEAPPPYQEPTCRRDLRRAS